jgi:hypothetical protein
MKRLWLLLAIVSLASCQTITTLQPTDLLSDSRAVINTNFSQLNTYTMKNHVFNDLLMLSTPGTSPTSGYLRVYAKTGSGVCWKTSAGVETCASDASVLSMTQAVENSVANSVSVGVGTSGRAFAKTPVTIDPTTGAIASASTDPTSIEYKWQAGTLAAGASGKTNTGMSTAGVPVWRAYGGAEKTTMATDTVASDAQLTGVAALSATLTNKTLDVEGTGNSITTVQKVWFDAVNCTGTTATLNWDTIATLAPTASCSAGTTNTGLIRGLAAFADGTDVYQMQTPNALPSDWTGAVDLKFKWQTSATSGSVVWQAATVCVADAEVNDAAWNTASTVTDAAKGTTLQTNDASIAGLTTTGCAAGELLHLKIFRDPAHASDDLAAAANLIGVEVTTRRAQ